VPIASVREVQSFDLDLAHAKRTTVEWYERMIGGGRRPARGDVIYCRNASVGAAAYVPDDVTFAMGQDVCLITSDCQNQRHLNYLLHSPFMKVQLDQMLVGATFKRINVAQIRSLLVLTPPRLEQDRICSELDRRMHEFAEAESRARRVIDLLREYRTRLIADVVTGKLDVRGVELPPLDSDEPFDVAELIDEPEAIDEEPRDADA
jgi:type I restriction enzyme S subunit